MKRMRESGTGSRREVPRVRVAPQRAVAERLWPRPLGTVRARWGVVASRVVRSSGRWVSRSDDAGEDVFGYRVIGQ